MWSRTGGAGVVGAVLFQQPEEVREVDDEQEQEHGDVGGERASGSEDAVRATNAGGVGFASVVDGRRRSGEGLLPVAGPIGPAGELPGRPRAAGSAVQPVRQPDDGLAGGPPPRIKTSEVEEGGAWLAPRRLRPVYRPLRGGGGVEIWLRIETRRSRGRVLVMRRDRRGRISACQPPPPGPPRAISRCIGARAGCVSNKNSDNIRTRI